MADQSGMFAKNQQPGLMPWLGVLPWLRLAITKCPYLFSPGRVHQLPDEWMVNIRFELNKPIGKVRQVMRNPKDDGRNGMGEGHPKHASGKLASFSNQSHFHNRIEHQQMVNHKTRSEGARHKTFPAICRFPQMFAASLVCKTRPIPSPSSSSERRIKDLLGTW